MDQQPLKRLRMSERMRENAVRTVKRMVEDLDNALDRIRNGEPMESVLKPPQPVESFQLDDDLDSDDGMETDGHHEGAKVDHVGAAQHKDGEAAHAGSFWEKDSWKHHASDGQK